MTDSVVLHGSAMYVILGSLQTVAFLAYIWLSVKESNKTVSRLNDTLDYMSKLHNVRYDSLQSEIRRLREEIDNLSMGKGGK